MQASRYGRGTSLRAIVDSPAYDVKDFEGVPELDATATMAEDGSVTLFVVNRSLDEAIELTGDLRDFKGLTRVEHFVLHHDDVKAVNTEANPDNVRPVAGPGGTLEGGRLTVSIPALSWNVIRLTK
jgi:alpha-N-arabinofuranosidase